MTNVLYGKEKERDGKIIIVHLPIMCETTIQTQCRTYDFSFCLLDGVSTELDNKRHASYAVWSVLLSLCLRCENREEDGWKERTIKWSAERLERCHVNLFHNPHILVRAVSPRRLWILPMLAYFYVWIIIKFVDCRCQRHNLVKSMFL